MPGCGTDPLPIVRYDAKDRQRRLDLMRWGLLPFWAKDIKVGFSNINAKAEVIENKHAFREAFRQRRCLVPVDNFYERAKTASGKHKAFERRRRLVSVDNFYEWKKTESGKQQAALWRSRSPTAASWRSRANGKTGVRRPVNVFAASRSSPRSPTKVPLYSRLGSYGRAAVGARAQTPPNPERIHNRDPRAALEQPLDKPLCCVGLAGARGADNRNPVVERVCRETNRRALS